MKKQVEFNKFLKRIIIFIIIEMIGFLALLYFQNKIIINNYNKSVSRVMENIKENYPDISNDALLEILENRSSENTDFFDQYSLEVGESIVGNTNRDVIIFIATDVIFLLLCVGLVVFFCTLYEKKRRREIEEIAGYINQINNKNYELDIDSISEDELSILKNEIYKTTIMLKEAAENSQKEKKDLKVSLEDISHQIKTPLTSILVIMDNLIAEPDMDERTRNDFIMDIKREINNVNFMVQTLLKLSKFDSNTMKFNIKENDLSDIVDGAVKNVEMLMDLRNISIKCKKESIVVNCDLRWQIEALTNIMKNCIEHSQDNSEIEVEISGNDVYKSISVLDHAGGISDKDMPHLFERFYKGEHSKSDSYGIGLALAKTIVESNNGGIFVDNEGDGARFTIRYYVV